MIDIKSLLTKTNEKTVLISTPTEYKDSVLLDTLSMLNSPNTLVIYNGSLSYDQLDICNPKKAIDRIHHKDYHYIFIVNVYSFDIDHGHHIEYILQFRHSNTRIVYIAPFCNFVAISEWLYDCKIINYDSSVSHSVIGYEDSKNDFAFEMKLNYKIHPFINKQTIIYCATQKMCKISAEHVLKDFCKLSKERILEMEFDSSDLQSCALFGIGYITNDLCDSDKVNIIKLYNAKRIGIIFLHKYVEYLGADTYIFKSTKTYKELEYQERQSYEIVGMCRSAYKNANIYIMTTKSMQKFYKDVFGSKLGLDYKDVVSYAKQPSAIVPYYKFSSVEHHLDEYILYIMLYSENYNYKEYIKKSFFYHCLGPKKIELDIDLLVSEIVDSLAINRIITSAGTCKNAINTDLVNVFVNNDIPFNLFTKLIGIEGSESSIIAQIAKFPEVKTKLQSKIKYNRNEDLFTKLTHNTDLRASAFGIAIKNYVKICLDIKLLLGQNIGKVAYLNSILNSTGAQKRYLDYQNIQDDSFSTYDIDLAIKSDRCIIKINNDKQYHYVVEKSNILLHEKIFYNNYNCMLENDTIIYCICITDNSLSAVLKYENGCLNIVHKYYRASIKNYVSKPKITQKIENVKKVKYTEEYNGVKIEFAAPLNITLPEWFSK